MVTGERRNLNQCSRRADCVRPQTGLHAKRIPRRRYSLLKAEPSAEPRLAPSYSSAGDAASRVSTGKVGHETGKSRSGNFHTLLFNLVENAGRGVENFLIHLTIRSDGLGQRDRNNLVPA